MQACSIPDSNCNRVDAPQDEVKHWLALGEEAVACWFYMKEVKVALLHAVVCAVEQHVLHSISDSLLPRGTLPG